MKSSGKTRVGVFRWSQRTPRGHVSHENVEAIRDGSEDLSWVRLQRVHTPPVSDDLTQRSFAYDNIITNNLEENIYDALHGCNDGLETD